MGAYSTTVNQLNTFRNSAKARTMNQRIVMNKIASFISSPFCDSISIDVLDSYNTDSEPSSSENSGKAGTNLGK